MMNCERVLPERADLVPAGFGRARGFVQRFPDCLGPMPEATLSCLVDLGLSDAEIASYFRLERARVAALTQAVRGRTAL